MPVGALAFFALLAVRKDRVRVEDEARAWCRIIAENLGQSLFRAINQGDLFHYGNAQARWSVTQKAALGLVPKPNIVSTALALVRWRGVSADEFAAQKLTDDWLRAHSEIDFRTLPQALWNGFAEDGSLIQPSEHGSPPRPAEWFLALPDDARRAWQSAENAINARASNALAQIDTFINSAPGTNAVANAEWLRLSWQSRENPSADVALRLIDFGRSHGNERTESGLPLGQTAWLRALQLWPQEMPLPDHFWTNIAFAVQGAPSILIPELLDRLATLGQKQDQRARRQADLLKSVWAVDERTRHVLQAFRRQHPSETWTDRFYWVHSEIGDYLANGRKVLPLRKDQATANTATAVAFNVFLYPKAVVERAFLGAFASADAGLPNYARARVRLAGEELELRPGASFSPFTRTNNSLLAEDSLPLPPGATYPPFIVRTNRPRPAGVRTAGEKRELRPGVTFSFVTRTNDVLLAEYSLPFPGYSPADGFKLQIHLANPALLFERQRQLTLGFIAVILLAALAAAFGWWQSWRTLRHQLELNEMKSNFVSSVSHELRAPIASVRLMAEGLESGRVRDEPKRAEYFKFIVQECRRLTSLIENVLDFSRIEQGRKQYEFEPVDPVALIEQTVKLMQNNAEERGVRLVCEYDSTKLSGTNFQLLADGRALQQALVNLIDNAIKHSPQNETVTVELDIILPESPGRAGRPQPAANVERTAASPPMPRRGEDTTPCQTVQLSVSDHGPGIPPEEHEHIFERFYRRGSELRRETQGVGIGLSIVKHIVEAHKGRVRVDSAPGKGSRFTIELPTGGSNDSIQS